jgi:hypothetical protein
MNTTKIPRGIGMKYTRNLMYGNFFQNNIEISKDHWSYRLVSMLDLVRAFYLLGFSILLFPFALTIDTGRLFYYLELKLSRKLKQISQVYKYKKNPISLLVYRSSQLAYLIIHKTDSIIHLKT